MHESSRWKKLAFVEHEIRKTQVEIVRLMQYEHVLTQIAESVQREIGSDTATALQDEANALEM